MYRFICRTNHNLKTYECVKVEDHAGCEDSFLQLLLIPSFSFNIDLSHAVQSFRQSFFKMYLGKFIKVIAFVK